VHVTRSAHLSLHPLRRRHLLTGLAVALALSLAACGTDDPSPAASEPEPPSVEQDTPASEDPGATDDAVAGFPVEVAGVEIPARPERIVSLSPTATEMLFAIGAGDRVAAVDQYSNFPDEAPITELSGFQPNVEAIVTFDPDLVVVSSNPGELIESLAALGIPTLLLPSAATIDEAYTQIGQLGVATGTPEGAAAVVADMRTAIDATLDALDGFDAQLTYYHELTPDFYSVSSDTFIGDVYALLGLTSIADAVGEAGGMYPQLSPEFIIDADPDLIFLADAACCGVTADHVAARPGWDTIRAVRTGAIVELDEDIASRWGPRIVQLLRDVADAVQGLVHEPARG
jgi:iron complex transport system substrate-binding protein